VTILDRQQGALEAPAPVGRPAVSTIVPFAGGAPEARALLAMLARLRLRPGDELIVVDNSLEGVVPATGAARVIRAGRMRSSYYARNAGAEAATADWLLFLDADCVAPPDLLDRYFADPPADGDGAVAGEVLGLPSQTALAARYARSRRHLVQRDILERPAYRPMAVTANLLVRREAFEAVGGFHEGIRSGGDADFSWRLQDAGFAIAHRPDAAVGHRHRESLRGLLRQAARIGAGRAWAGRRHPAFRYPNPLRALARSAAGVAWWTARGRLERARFKALDGLWVAAESGGYLLPNAARRPARAELAVLVDTFPAMTETFVAAEVGALRRAGREVAVEALARPERPLRGAAREVPVSWWEDDGIAQKLTALAWLAGRHPLRVVADLAARRRWHREEEVWPLRALAPCARRLARGGATHLHAHFASQAALSAVRLGRLLGLPYSVTVHAYDAFRSPANLSEKLNRAAFATSVCDYTVRHLREETGATVHEVGMGIDTERFRRRTPPPGGRTVAAVGRLVEKKGFADLIRACALLEGTDGVRSPTDGDRSATDGDRSSPGPRPLDRVLIAGDGPLAAELRALAQRLGVAHRVRFLGALEHDGVRDLLERCDLLAMPSVVASDGDRDSLPVVVEEAMALELPVVATSVGGLPEVVRPEWGRVVEPGAPGELAVAIADVLARPPAERAAMGAAARAWIREHRDVDREAAKLAALIAAS
jgi:glycosyltransferase involved in cell wall biosynthesis/GT2 family glycosyltransferase